MAAPVGTSKKKVVVVGAGFVGTCTSWMLARDGWEVTCLESLQGAGAFGSASYLNGGLLCPSLTYPWTNFGALKLLATSQFTSDSTAKVKIGALSDPLFWGWAFNFLQNVRASRIEENFIASYELAKYSMQCMDGSSGTVSKDASTIPIGKDNYRRIEKSIGSLQLFQSPEKMMAVLAACTAGLGPKTADSVYQSLTREQCEISEPVLADLPVPVGAGLLGLGDASGDISAYTRSLAQKSAGVGVCFRYGSRVAGFTYGTGLGANKGNKKIEAVVLDSGESIAADAFVIAAGNGSEALASMVGDPSTRSYPIKGCVMEVPLAKGKLQLRCNVVDDVAKVYVSPLSDGFVRLSGCVDFNGSRFPPKQTNQSTSTRKLPKGDDAGALAGSEIELDVESARALLRRAKSFLPLNYLDADENQITKVPGVSANGFQWHACFRPQTPDDLPVVGQSQEISNLYYNCGHGHIGWTRGAGSAALLCDVMANRKPALDMSRFRPGRFTKMPWELL